MNKAVALIPARSGSKRVKDKNIMSLNGHPIMAYTIRSAVDSGEFEKVVVATDSEEYASVARRYGAEVPSLRPTSIAGDKSPDIEWLKWIFSQFYETRQQFEVFAILRPSSPLRTASTIKRAFAEFSQHPRADSLRAIELCSQHPGKMWIVKQDFMFPLLPFSINEVPWHSNQYGALPEVFIQNASLEIGRVDRTLNRNSLAGEVVLPFKTNNLEGFDINYPSDWTRLLDLVSNSKLDPDTLFHLRDFEVG